MTPKPKDIGQTKGKKGESNQCIKHPELKTASGAFEERGGRNRLHNKPREKFSSDEGFLKNV